MGALTHGNDKPPARAEAGKDDGKRSEYDDCDRYDVCLSLPVSVLRASLLTMPVMRPTNGGWRGILVAGKSRRMKGEDDIG